MKRFMYFSIGVLCLSITTFLGFHIGSQSAQAQAPGPSLGYTSMAIVGGPNGPYSVMLENGDVYVNWPQGPTVPDGWGFSTFSQSAVYLGNFWTGQMGPTPTSPGTWGNIKGLYGEKK